MENLIQARRGRLMMLVMLAAAAVVCAIILYPGASGASLQNHSTDEVSPSNGFQLLSTTQAVAPPNKIARAIDRAPVDFGLELGGARQATSTGAWLIPGNGQLCIAADDSEGIGMSCTTTDSAEQGTLEFVTHSADGSTKVVGAAPDGMRSATAYAADGSTVASSAVSENTYVVSGKGISGTTLTP